MYMHIYIYRESRYEYADEYADKLESRGNTNDTLFVHIRSLLYMIRRKKTGFNLIK